MTTFVIATDNNISAFAAPEDSQDTLALGGQAFVSEKELGKVAAEWPTSRLVEIWNSFAGVAPFTDLKPVTKFENRQKAVKRIWQAVQKLATGAHQGAQDGPEAAGPTKEATSAKKAAKRPKSAKKTRSAGKVPATREGSKKAEVLALMRRRNGATLKEIMEATGWQAHTVRGFVSGTLIKKQRLKVESFRRDDKERTYRITG
jgi:hypothetical protein